MEFLEESFLGNIEEEEEKEKTIFFLGERVVEPVNQVIFENGMFFVERCSDCLVIRSKTVKEYLKHVRGTKRAVKFERTAKDILIPLHLSQCPMVWFKEMYVENAKGNQQGRFIREVWKYRNEVFGEVMVG